jgi:hypothetical protein
MTSRYIISPASNYAEFTETNRRNALRYARNITDSTNARTTVHDAQTLDRHGEPAIIAEYRYSPQMGGYTYRAEVGTP